MAWRTSMGTVLWLLATLAGGVGSTALAQNLEFRSSITQETTLDGVTHAAWSPDGGFLYAVAKRDNTLIQFIPATDGRLTFGQVLRDGEGGVDGLEGADAVALSPTGEHLYAASAVDGAVAVFSRDAGSGALTFVEAIFDSAMVPLDGATFLSVSPDGAHLYVVAETEKRVVVFSRDPATGQLAFVQAFEHGELSRSVQLAISADGANVYVASRSNSRLVVLDRNETTGELVFKQAFRNGTDPGQIEDLFLPAAVVVSPDDLNVYVGTSADFLHVFDRDVNDGTLTFAQRLEDDVDGVDGLDRIFDLAISADGANVYAAAAVDDAVGVFQRDGMGRLTFLQVQADGVGRVLGLDAVQAVVISPDDSLVHAVSDQDRALAGFIRNTDTGTLAFSAVRRQPDGEIVGLDGPGELVVDPGGRVAYTAGARDDAIGIFSIDPDTLSLGFVGAAQNGVDSIEGLRSVIDVALTPDRAFVYAVSPVDDAVSIFHVVGMDGALQFGNVFRNGGNGGAITGMVGPTALAISPDNRHLYVAGTQAGSIVVFARDLLTGDLIHVQTLTNGENGITGMSSPELLEFTPDGALLFVVSSFSTTVLAFARDAQTGELAFIGDGSTATGSTVTAGGSAGMAGGTTVTRQIRSPNNRFLYQLISNSGTPESTIIVLKIGPDGAPDPESAVEIDMSRPYSDLEISEDGDLFATDELGNVFMFELDSDTGVGTLVDPWEEMPTTKQQYRTTITLPNGRTVVLQRGADGILRMIEDTDTSRQKLNVSVSKSVFDEQRLEISGRSVVSYTLEVSNGSPIDAPGITLHDALPIGAFEMFWVVTTGVPGFEQGTSGIEQINKTFSLPTNRSVRLQVVIESPLDAWYRNEATIEGDDHPADNRAVAASPALAKSIVSKDGFGEEEEEEQ